MPYRLRTSFHRHERADLHRFLNDDIPLLHRHLSATTRTVFDLNDPLQFGAFLNLAQHHGYPTPLLDWSYSPFVAAFFAFRGFSNAEAESAGEEVVRIYFFDAPRWKSDWPQPWSLINIHSYVSVLEFLALENQRMLPQQAVSMLSNMDDIERHITEMAKKKNVSPYLSAVDIKKSERSQVMRELAFMGITAASLFPGLDGACEALREKNFQA